MACEPTVETVGSRTTICMTNRDKIIDSITDDDLIEMLYDTVDEDNDCNTCKARLICSHGDKSCSESTREYLRIWLDMGCV